MTEGTLYDGLTARERRVVLTFAPDGLIVDDAQIALSDLRRTSAGDAVQLRRIDAPDWRLRPDAAPPDWLASLRDIGHVPRQRIALWTGIGLAGAGLIAALLLWGGALLTWAAPLVPRAVSVQIGKAAVGQMTLGSKSCETRSGQAALDRLVARLEPPNGFVEPVQLTVIESPVVNAFAVPGGQIAIFSGLIDEARSPDEIAGVIAHELGHVQHRHPNRALIRQMGISLAAQALGGHVGEIADVALLVRGTRQAEAEADGWALDALARTRISPTGIADFFNRRIAEARKKPAKDGVDKALARFGNFAATHPAAADRMQMFRAAARRNNAPALNAADWAAVKSICAPKA